MTDISEQDPREPLEHAEHAAHAAASADPMVLRISLSIAVMAVAAAMLGTLEGAASSNAILAKNDAVLLQAKASDTWSLYEAKSVKKNMYAIAGEQGGPSADRFKSEADREKADADATQVDAKRLEAESEAANRRSEEHLHQHHLLSLGTTVVHGATAAASVAILIRKRWFWYLSVAAAAAGTIAGLAVAVT